MTDHSDLIAELRDEGMRLSSRSIDRGCVDSGIAAVLADRAADALSSQSLSLSEAREEIERLKGLVAGIRETPQELADARVVITEANNSLFGSQGYFLSMNGGPADKYHLSRAIEDLKADTRQSHKMAEALKPFARLKVPWKSTYNAGAYSILFDDIRRAQSALENSKARLADAHTNPPLSDLSSLRKGAEEHRAVILEALKQAASGGAAGLADHELAEIADGLCAALVSGSREDGE